LALGSVYVYVYLPMRSNCLAYFVLTL